MKNILHIHLENPEDFKNEIIRGVVAQIKDLGIYNQKKEENPNDLVTRAETVKILNISLVKLWELTKQTSLPSIKIGGKVLYKRSVIMDFINSQSMS
ncbi:helix-turn-helix domain-containing protein [Flavobacterium sp.]|uniref:helix-turn-helix domain-containing protein n=1 Tax=Flavobacterium sp. TaxID=239 RepID=UPI003D2D64DC